MAPETRTAKKPSSRSWEAQNLPAWCLGAVSSLGYVETTPVQAAVMPLFLGNSDVVVEAPTGSGKSISFLLPLCAKILREEPTKRHHIAAIVVTPTRELATQLAGVLHSLLAFHPASADILPCLKDYEKRPATTEPVIVPQLVVGGTTKPAEDVSFFLRHSPNVLIATPGRLAEFISNQHVNSTSSFQMLVLDEADRLLDLGFSRELDRILAFLPKQRRTGLFSASVGEALGQLIKVQLRNPRHVVVRVKSLKDNAIIEEKKTPASLTMSYLVLPPEHKIPAVVQLLEKLDPRPQRIIAFLASCFSVKYFAAVLPALLPPGFSVLALHGKMEPPAREKSFAKFVGSSSPTLLLTTDIASRGLDIPAVDLVLNLDPPSDPKTFIHRCGRSGRAGRRGLAVTLLLPGREEDFIPFMALRQTPLAPLTHPPLTITAAHAADATARIRAQTRQDRDLFALSQRAFPSWVRAYQEHRAASIFRVADLDLVALAHAWGLLRLPRMPELRAAAAAAPVDRSLGLDVDVAAIPFRDKVKERKRLAELAAAGEAEEEEEGAQKVRGGDRDRKRRNNDAWSGQADREGVRAARREKKRRRREAEREAGMTEAERGEKRRLEALVEEVRRTNMANARSEKDVVPALTRDGGYQGAMNDAEGGFEGFSD